jgi:hypothetical protein
MLLSLGAAAIVGAALLWELTLPRMRGSLAQYAHTLAGRRRARRAARQLHYDPGRELRAEQRARELLCSCVNEEEWAMYRDLGFLRVWSPAAGGGSPAAGGDPAHDAALAPYAYLLYPHRPIVAYVPRTGALLNEYCVAFPDDTRPTEAGGHGSAARIPVSTEAGGHGSAARIPVSASSARLPDADDVLAKWISLVADERRLIADANMHLPGRQVDPEQVREDLARLARWERERCERAARGSSSVPA